MISSIRQAFRRICNPSLKNVRPLKPGDLQSPYQPSLLRISNPQILNRLGPFLRRISNPAGRLAGFKSFWTPSGLYFFWMPSVAYLHLSRIPMISWVSDAGSLALRMLPLRAMPLTPVFMMSGISSLVMPPMATIGISIFSAFIFWMIS